MAIHVHSDAHMVIPKNCLYGCRCGLYYIVYLFGITDTGSQLIRSDELCAGLLQYNQEGVVSSVHRA